MNSKTPDHFLHKEKFIYRSKHPVLFNVLSGERSINIILMWNHTRETG